MASKSTPGILTSEGGLTTLVAAFGGIMASTQDVSWQQVALVGIMAVAVVAYSVSRSGVKKEGVS